jgi:hypothetical protein
MNNKWKVSPEVLSSKIDEEVVLMSIEAGYYFGLEPVGSRIWEILSEKPATFDELVTQLMDEYDVDMETCQNDVKSFIDDMVSKKLISPTD